MLEHQEAWRAEWLRLRGLPEWARYLQSYPAGEPERQGRAGISLHRSRSRRSSLSTE
jgi:hypothetical protein